MVKAEVLTIVCGRSLSRRLTGRPAHSAPRPAAKPMSQADGHHPDLSRRALVGAGVLAAALASPAEAASPAPVAGLRPNASEDQTAALAAALTAATRAGRALHLGPGRYRVGGLALPAGARLTGEGDATVLVQAGDAPLPLGGRRGCRHGSGPGAARQPGTTNPATPLAAFTDVRRLALCELSVADARNGAAPRALRRPCGAQRDRERRRRGVQPRRDGLQILANDIDGCANNGIQVWRSRSGEDGSSSPPTASRGSGPRARAAPVRTATASTFPRRRRARSDNASPTAPSAPCAATPAPTSRSSATRAANLGEVRSTSSSASNGCVVANNLVDRASVGIR